NMFKMILGSSVPEPEGEYRAFCESRPLGPPGGEVIGRAIISELGADIPREGVQWAVRSLFSSTMHFVLLMGSRHLQKVPHCSGEDLTKKLMEKQIKTHVAAVLEYLDRH